MRHLNLLTENVHRLYFKYLFPSICSTLVTSIYILADTIMIGHGVGSDGIVALNLVIPVFSIYFGIGILFGVGGGVLMSVANGGEKPHEAHAYFTAALISVSVMAALVTLVGTVFFEPFAYLLGADSTSIDLVREYGYPTVMAAPVFVFSYFLQAFIRNDKAPRRAMAGVLTGAIINIGLDYLFIFPLQMGMFGAILATILGNSATVLILLTHFFSKHNTIRFEFHFSVFHRLPAIAACGISSFLLEISSGIVVFFFNMQLLRYIGDTGIVVYGIIANFSIVAVSLFNGVSQAAQPLIASNFGAKLVPRVISLRRTGILTCSVIGVLLFTSCLFFAETFIHAFVVPTEQVLELGIPALHIYFSAFLLMGFNIFYCNYFQAIVLPRAAFLICLLRGLILNIGLVFLLPAIWGANAIWFVIPAVEVLTFGVSLILVKRMSPQQRILVSS